MSNIAFLAGDIVIYWSQIILVLGLIAGCMFAFVLRPFTKVKKKAMVLWLILTFVFSVLFSKALYYYCVPEQFISIQDALWGLLDEKHCIVGVVPGALFASLIVKITGWERKIGKLLDTGFPGVVLAIAMIRLSCLFTDVYHSKLVVENPIFQRIPFAILSTDAAGNIAYVFAPFLISFIVLVISDLLSILFARRMVKHQGDMFLLTFVCFALSEMVLEGTQYDVLRLHFTFLYSVNKYVSFISFSMFIFGICMLVVFFVNHRKAVKKTGHRKSTFPMIVFILAFLCFCVCEYLVQRYTSQEVLFHLIQAGLAATMAVSTIMVINLKNTKVKRKRKSDNTLRPQHAAAPAATEPVVAEQQPG